MRHNTVMFAHGSLYFRYRYVNSLVRCGCDYFCYIMRLLIDRSILLHFGNVNGEWSNLLLFVNMDGLYELYLLIHYVMCLAKWIERIKKKWTKFVGKRERFKDLRTWSHSEIGSPHSKIWFGVYHPIVQSRFGSQTRVTDLGCDAKGF